MASVVSLLTRGLLSLIHISIGAVVGIFVVYTLVRWGTLDECLPPMVQLSGSTVFKMKTQLPELCDCIYIVLCVAGFLNMAMCAFTNLLWKYESSAFLLLNMFLTLAIAGFSVFVASLMTTYRMVWCDVIRQRMSKDLDNPCSTAATNYAKITGSSNMTSYYDRLELQVLGLWSLVPLTVVVIFLYGVAVNIERATTSTTTTTTTANHNNHNNHNHTYSSSTRPKSRSSETTPLIPSPPTPTMSPASGVRGEDEEDREKERDRLNPFNSSTPPPPELQYPHPHHPQDSSSSSPSRDLDFDENIFKAPGEGTPLLVNSDRPGRGQGYTQID